MKYSLSVFTIVSSLIFGCTALKNPEINSESELPKVIVKIDNNGNSKIEFKGLKKNRIPPEEIAKLENKAYKLVGGGSSELVVGLYEALDPEQFFIQDIKNTGKVKPIANSAYENHIATLWKYGLGKYIKIDGRVKSIRNQKNGDIHIKFESFNWLLSTAHKIDDFYIEITANKMTRLSEHPKIGNFIHVEGFLSKKDNDLIISAQGKFYIKNRPTTLSNLGYTIPVEIIRENNENIGKTKVGKITVIQ